MGCFIRWTTAVTLIAGTQFLAVGMAQAAFEPQDRRQEFNGCSVRSEHLGRVTCPFNQQAEETPPNTNGTGGAR